MLQEEIVSSIYGALRLARFDPRGMAYFNLTLDGFWRSFLAAVLAAPLQLLSLLITSSDTSPSIGNEMLRYAIGAVLFPIVMIPIAKVMRLSASYVPFVIAYNWSWLVQSVLYFLVTALFAMGVPVDVIGLLYYIVLVYMLVYFVFIARTTLGVSSLVGAVLAFVDLGLAFAVAILG